jgi:protein-disulfide isomerase
MDFPLAFHKKAQKAHEAANCAGKEGKYWDMHEVLFASKKLEPGDLYQHADNLGLDKTAFNSCMESGAYASEIKQDMAEGQKAGVRGTPSFLLGWEKPGEDKVYAVKFIRGAQPYENIKAQIDELLKEQAEKEK